MRNLLMFIWKYQFTFIFIILETIGFLLLAQSNSFHQSKLHAFSVAVSGTFYEARQAYTQYIGLRDENEKLQKENAALRQTIMNSNQSTDNIIVNDYDCIAAQVVTSTYHLGYNFIIIDKGMADGIDPESGVIGPDGLVGVVHSVSDNYASIMPIIHRSIQVSAKLKKIDYFGILDWKETDYEFATLNDIPNHVDVLKGDTIITRGSSGIFPQGLVVGFAESSERDASSGFQTISLKLATDFRKVSSVYVIINHHREELDSMQQSSASWTE